MHFFPICDETALSNFSCEEATWSVRPRVAFPDLESCRLSHHLIQLAAASSNLAIFEIF
jgi:hypothetical protein